MSAREPRRYRRAEPSSALSDCVGANYDRVGCCYQIGNQHSARSSTRVPDRATCSGVSASIRPRRHYRSGTGVRPWRAPPAASRERWFRFPAAASLVQIGAPASSGGSGSAAGHARRDRGFCLLRRRGPHGGPATCSSCQSAGSRRWCRAGDRASVVRTRVWLYTEVVTDAHDPGVADEGSDGQPCATVHGDRA